ncbi:MAG: patatin-like phospholipase family protein [Thermoanaerobaculia bacterium]
MSLPDGRRVAVVLSGGGANGAYEVGVLKALMNGMSPVNGYQRLVPDIITGTSIGAFNAAFLVSQWDQYGPAAVANLEQLWLERMAGGVRSNGVFRLRGNPLELVDPSSYVPNPLQTFQRFAVDGGVLAWDGLQRAVELATSRRRGPLERRLLESFDLSVFLDMEPFEETLRMVDYRAVQRSALWLKVAATNWATGQLRVFWNRDMTETFGPFALRASAAVPGVFPPVEYGAQPFVDGSILMNTPLSPAIHAGAQVLHVIYLDPDVSNIPLSRRPQTYSSIYRIFQIAWATAYNDDIGDAARINRSLAALERWRAQRPLDPETEGLLLDLAQLRTENGRAPFRPLTIHRFHPRDPLAGDMSFLNFDRDRIEMLIERGFQDAVYHDPGDSGDVFPEGEGIPAQAEGRSRGVS